MKLYFNFQVAFIFFIILSNTPTFGQAIHSGIFLTDSAFEKNELTLKIDCNIEKHKIELNDFLGKPYIKVIHEGKMYKYNKNEIFGYRTCDDKNYRFYKKNEYEILNKDKLTLYSQSSTTTISGQKGIFTITNYFFSSSFSSDLIPLTSQNLKNQYPGNHKFHDMLDAQFENDEDLMMFDEFHNRYKINHLFDESLRN